MKANDIQIGDWLYSIIDRYDHVEKKLCKVTGIRTDSDTPLIQCDDTDVWYPLDSYESVPLTPEILEKNGFECKHKGEALKRLYWILNVEGGSVKVKVNRGLFLFDIYGVPFQHGFYCPFVNKHIQYVHQLQHALKLCGIEKELIL